MLIVIFQFSTNETTQYFMDYLLITCYQSETLQI